MDVGGRGRKLYTCRYTVNTRMTPSLRLTGSEESHFDVSLTVRDTKTVSYI